jgi:hypothetical protein
VSCAISSTKKLAVTTRSHPLIVIQSICSTTAARARTSSPTAKNDDRSSPKAAETGTLVKGEITLQQMSLCLSCRQLSVCRCTMPISSHDAEFHASV